MSHRAPGDERGASGERIDVAGELAWFVYRYDVWRPARLLDDFDCPLKDYEEGKAAVPFPEQHVAGRCRSHVPPTTQRI
jgi:hypothetical protein